MTYKYILVLAMLMLGCAENGANNTTTKTTPKTLSMFVPLYSWPDLKKVNNEWQQVANAAATVPVIAVINPNSGPLTPAPQAYLDGIQMLKNAGVRVLGYVPTGFGLLSISSIKLNMDAYIPYQVDGIFFDEVENIASSTTRYETLCSHHLQMLTVLNPGTAFPNSYLAGACDMAVVYENNASLWLNTTLTVENASLSPQSLIALVHTANPAFLKQDINHAAALGIGAIMVTDKALGSNMLWVTLPSNLQQEVSNISQTALPL